MRFISPKTDFAFKKIFGSNESKDILISFLNSMIYSDYDIIQDLDILDPYSAGNTVDLKDSYLDVKAILADNTHVIIEMQVWNVEAFERRVVYNLCKTYVNQLKSGQGYSFLDPVIALTITDFKLFANTKKTITRFHFQEEMEKISYQEKELKLVFVELPKFKKNLDELETIADKWIYFIKEAPNLEIIPNNMKQIPQIDKALNIANQASLTTEELDKLHKQEMLLRDRQGEMIFAKREAREEGREEGKIEGERGLLLRQLQRRFGELTVETIDLIENLDSQSLENLGDAIWEFTTPEDLIHWLQES